MKGTKFSVIAACFKKSRIIGVNNQLPWKSLKEDMEHFKEITINVNEEGNGKGNSRKYMNSVIMGKNTWLSIPEKFRPLPGRVNIIVSKSLLNGKVSGSMLEEKCEKQEHSFVVESLRDALNFQYPLKHPLSVTSFGSSFYEGTHNHNHNRNRNHNIANIDKCETYIDKNIIIKDRFVIGGEGLFREALQNKWCEKIYLTEVEDGAKVSQSDTTIKESTINSYVYMPNIPNHFGKVSTRKGNTSLLTFVTYEDCSNPLSQEENYLQLMKNIL